MQSSRYGSILARTISATATACLALTGCAHHPAPPHYTSSAHNSFRIVLRTSPKTPRQLDPVRFVALLNNKNSAPVHAANVKVELTMPGMEMPPNVIACHEASPGVYMGEGRFTMPGDWRARVEVNRDAENGGNVFSIMVR